MAKSIKLGADTYLDASGVMMRSSSSAYRKTLEDWANGMVDTEYINLPASGSVTLTLTSSTRALLFVLGGNQNGSGIYILSISGTTAFVTNLVNGSALTLTPSGDTITITNGVGAVARMLMFVPIGTVSAS